ncbi:hypothetical protein LEP3755_36050 [Leptolyngbya sp. NIES-3755]|nr:hypothetical protein LEP3755_36050 [Leptolyngbya sp. NIES-3755]
MSSLRLEKEPLNCFVATKINQSDYQALQARVKQEGCNQTALIRLAVRQFLYTGLTQTSSIPLA